jgi:non-lysosomal glucosylceramidase
MCTWPRGGRPRFPFVYSVEVWTGIEYQVAAHLVYAGQPDAAMEMVAAVQARHDGARRNPWNEVECGHHYARSMASWAVLLALSGFGCDVSAGTLTFAPALPGPFRGFFSNGTGWGVYSQHEAPSGLRCELRLDSGVVRLGELRLAGAAQAAVASLNGVAIPATVAGTPQGCSVRFDRQLELSAGDVLAVFFPAGKGE